MQVQAEKYITQVIRHRVVEPHDDHVDPFKAWHLAHILDRQRIANLRGIFGVRRESVHALTGEQIQIHREEFDTRAGIAAERR